jgi:hypothetical protein
VARTIAGQRRGSTAKLGMPRCSIVLAIVLVLVIDSRPRSKSYPSLPSFTFVLPQQPPPPSNGQSSRTTTSTSTIRGNTIIGDWSDVRRKFSLYLKDGHQEIHTEGRKERKLALGDRSIVPKPSLVGTRHSWGQVRCSPPIRPLSQREQSRDMHRRSPTNALETGQMIPASHPLLVAVGFSFGSRM